MTSSAQAPEATPKGPAIRFDGVEHFYGEGATRTQVLFGIEAEIEVGEIVILTGPSGSGKTTALTLAGALRSAQHGSLRVLGEEILGASRSKLVSLRRRIGYIFQHHNLIEALTATRNVEMALAVQGDLTRRAMRDRARQMLEAVGLGEHLDDHPSTLSGGQKQRVAIARALAGRPRIVLADEPTASLDKQSGRAVVSLLEELAREQGTTVLLVTHDNRILDVADRILHLEDGRIKSFGEAVMGETQRIMGLLEQSNRKGGLARRVEGLGETDFAELLSDLTNEAQVFLRVTAMAQNQAYESMLDQLLEACTRKVGQLLEADRASLFLFDAETGELRSKVARDGGGAPFEIRIPRGRGIAGAVASSGETVNVPDAYSDPRFDRSADRDSGYRTYSLLCIPLRDQRGAVFGVAQLLNKRGREPFDVQDEARFGHFMESVGLLLESWWRMSQRGAAETAASASATDVPRGDGAS